MNSFRKSNTNNISRRESLETTPNAFNAELLNLQFGNKKKEVINEYVVKRKAELLEEMQQEQIRQEYDRKTDIQKLKALLANIKYQNDLMKLNLKKYDQINAEEQKFTVIHQNDLVVVNNQIDAEQEQNQALQQQIQLIGHSLRKNQKYNNTLIEQLQLFTQKQPQIYLKEFQNQQAFDAAKKQNTMIKQALQEEKEWQMKYLYENTSSYEHKNQIVKENLESLCQQEERLQYLQQQLILTEQQIQDIDLEISTKFNKIEECAEFLDELDDFDKIILIFVMEDPKDFELPEILENARNQLQKPKNRMQIADSEQEYIDRARFSSVSSRMKIFFKFHHNNLQKSIDDLIQVYRKSQFNEMTLKNRYEDLLDQKAKLKQTLEDLNSLEFYAMDDILFERDDQHMNIEELNVEAALVSKNQQIRLVENNAQFVMRMYSMLTNVLFRMINSLLNIKEVLKLVPQNYLIKSMNLLIISFYLKWTYNKLYSKLTTIHDQLESQFKIKIVVKDPVIRNSNQLLNAIYDHLEDRPAKRKTLIPITQKQSLSEILGTVLNKQELKSVSDAIVKDPILAQFFSITDLQNMVSQLDNYTLDSLLKKIKTDGYEIALTTATRQLKFLLNFIEEAVFDCKNIQEQQSSAKLLQQKYKLQDLMEKHMNSYEFKPKEWKRDVIESKIKQLKPLNGQPFEEQPSPITEMRIQQQLTTQPPTPKIQPIRTCRTEQSPNEIKRFIFTIDSQIPNCSQSQANQKQSDPIFIHLHHMNRKIKNLNRSQTQQKANPPHQFDVLFSKKSVELSRDSITNLQLKSTPIQQNKGILRTASKCPKLLNNTNNSTNLISARSKCNTKSSNDQKLELPQSISRSQLSSTYGSANKKLQDFFHMTSIRKK
ncbi:unnamed protein product (macronuclear) [Paramecium tetraurelia]|uniref:Transmembrane protein n=1 Tax=Paramecium tetraurelia TaxID=5888 RepID=A0DFT9_PARTE|nr:uncharacterized protein GSPATT00016719001 [Paramecium tetraurelia]CAK81906.1 unnamed protein product [Paramecium tetraurelia]|eukprot:XP_001449303.1 hypothetical protein (macronuclear) [Paramecium tetraurelia strain d4-2]